MKRIILGCLVVMCMSGCARYQMPPFSSAGEWTVQDNALINESAKLRLDCSSFLPVMPLQNEGKEESHFITSQAAFEHYDPARARFVKEVLKAIPMKIDSIEAIIDDDLIVLTPNKWSEWRPDYYCSPDGTTWVEQAWPVSSPVQPHDQMWRNLIINEKKHQILTVDRFVKQGRHFAIVQIYQSKTKKNPLLDGSMVDYTDRRNIQHVGSVLNDSFLQWINAWKNDYPKQTEIEP